MHNLPLLSTARADRPWLCWGCSLVSLMWHRAQEASKSHGQQSQSSAILAQFCNLKMRSWLASRQLQVQAQDGLQTGPSVQPVLNTTAQMFVKGNKEGCRAGAKSGLNSEICSSKALYFRFNLLMLTAETFSTKGSSICRA